MRIKKLYGLLLICVAIIVWRVADSSMAVVNSNLLQKVMGIQLVDIEKAIVGRDEITFSVEPNVTYNGVEIPYDSTSKTFYFPQNMSDGEWLGELTISMKDYLGDGFELFASQDTEYWYQKDVAIKEGVRLPLYLISDNAYIEAGLIFTGTPVINIVVEETEVVDVTLEENPDEFLYGAKEVFYGTFSLFDPGEGDAEYQTISSKIKFHRKGVSSMYHDKPSYSLKLKDVIGEDFAVQMLGMRKSDSWKLNSLYTDENRIREKTASHIWEELAQTNSNVEATGARMEYVEVILNNEYLGLYALVEGVDEEKLSLEVGEYLYKTANWDVPRDEQIQSSIDDKWNISSSMRIRYPDVIEDYEAAWLPMREYLNVFYRNPEFDYDYALNLVDMNNLADMMFFLMTVGGADNTYKNLYFSWQKDMEGNYCMVQIPWDMDLTFGKVYHNGYGHVRFVPSIDGVFAETSLPRFQIADMERMGDSVWERWNMQRRGPLSTEHIRELLVENRDYLVQTGAFRREAERWNVLMDNTNIDFLLEFQEERMNWLDEYYAEWTGQKVEE